MDKLNRKDIILLLLYAPGLSGEKGEAIKGITRFTKLLFLLKALYNIDKEVKNYYPFEAYKLGPFTDELYNDLDVLEIMHLIQVRSKDFVEESEIWETQEILGDLLTYADADAVSSEFYREFEYRLTDQGQKIAQEIYDSIAPTIKQSVENVKRKFASLPLVELLRYIYRKFPEMAKKTIREDLRE